jgi:hypothetical protein
MNNMQNKLHEKKGFALLLALIISTVVLAIGLSILEISINQINLSSTARESEFAFQAAHAGIDCAWYWRYEEAADYTASNFSTAIPTISCFGGTPLSSDKTRVLSNSSGYADLFSYTLEWGTPERCTEFDMYVMSATSDDITLNFANEAVGTDGLKTCEAGHICTVLVSDGYNRACDELTTSIFTVQREITVEF